MYPGNTSMPITNTLNLWSVQAGAPAYNRRYCEQRPSRSGAVRSDRKVYSPGDHNLTVVNFSVTSSHTFYSFKIFHAMHACDRGDILSHWPRRSASAGTARECSSLSPPEKSSAPKV